MGNKVAYSWISSVGPCPCETCNLWDVCKSDKLACKDFADYSYHGILLNQDREPTARQYQSIYRGDET